MGFYPPICLAVLNWNGRNHLEILIPSLLKAVERYRGTCRIVILDNPSPADDPLWIRETFPQVEVVESPENDYLYSYNWLLSRLEEPIVVLLNNDLKVDPDFLSPLVEPFSDPDVFSVSAQSLEWDGSAVTSAAYRLGMHHGWAYWDGFAADHPVYTLFAVGGFAAVDRKRFVELGGFDRLFHPAYGEDVDLCVRAWKRGWSSVYQPHSRVWHREGASWDGEPDAKRGSLIAKAQYLNNAKHFQCRRILLMRMLYLWVLCAQKRRKGDFSWQKAIAEARLRWKKTMGASLSVKKNLPRIDKALSQIGKAWVAPSAEDSTESILS